MFVVEVDGMMVILEDVEMIKLGDGDYDIVMVFEVLLVGCVVVVNIVVIDMVFFVIEMGGCILER